MSADTPTRPVADPDAWVWSVPATEGSKMHLVPPGPMRAHIRSETPMGFARAFYEANP